MKFHYLFILIILSYLSHSMEITQEILDNDEFTQYVNDLSSHSGSPRSSQSKSNKSSQYGSPKIKENLQKKYGTNENCFFPNQRLIEKFPDVEVEVKLTSPIIQIHEYFTNPNKDLEKKRQILKSVNIAIATELTEIHPDDSNEFYRGYATNAFKIVKKAINAKIIYHKDTLKPERESFNAFVKNTTIMIFLKVGWDGYKKASEEINLMKQNYTLVDPDDLTEIFYQYYFSLKIMEIARIKIYNDGVIAMQNEFDDFPAMQIKDFKVLYFLEKMLNEYALEKKKSILFNIFVEINCEYPFYCNILKQIAIMRENKEFEQFIKENETISTLPTHNEKCLQHNKCVVV